jgi:hypothetical protein
VPELVFLLAPAPGANAAEFSWAPVPGADGYVLEVGAATGASDVHREDLPSAAKSATVGGLAPRRRYFARLRARNQAGSSTSPEVRIESVDLGDVIDALYFGKGPLVPRDGAAGCASDGEHWATYAAGVAVRLRIASPTVSDTAQEAVREAADKWIATTGGTNSAIVELTGDPDPHPDRNQITVTTHPDPVSQGCSFARGCTLITIRGGAMVSARAVLGPTIAPDTSAYPHDAVGHGGLGMCHIDGLLIGGARNSMMSAGPGVFSCPAPSDTCDALAPTPLDSAAAREVYASGLPRGASRSAFVDAGLVPPSAGVSSSAAARNVRRIRVGPDEELVVIDHE